MVLSAVDSLISGHHRFVISEWFEMRNSFDHVEFYVDFSTGLEKSGALRFNVACDIFWRERSRADFLYNKVFMLNTCIPGASWSFFFHPRVVCLSFVAAAELVVVAVFHRHTKRSREKNEHHGASNGPPSRSSLLSSLKWYRRNHIVGHNETLEEY